jgi:flagellar motor switch protein FliN/FliY
MLNNLDDNDQGQDQAEAQDVEQNAPSPDSAVGEPVNPSPDSGPAAAEQPAPTPAGNSTQPASTPVQPRPPQKARSLSDLSAVNYEMLVDVPIRVTVELGRSQMTVQEILKLEKGSVIELNRIAGDPVDVFVNDYLIAKGEVVVVDDNFGVRITKIVAAPSVLGKN